MRRTAAILCRPVAGAALIAVVWGGLLPAALRWGPLARHVARMEDGGVNPAAMYYTELDRIPVRPPWLDDRLVRWPGRDSPARLPVAGRPGAYSRP